MLKASTLTKTVLLKALDLLWATSAVLKIETPLVTMKNICAANTGSDFVARSAANACAVSRIWAFREGQPLKRLLSCH